MAVLAGRFDIGSQVLDFKIAHLVLSYSYLCSHCIS